MHRGFLLFSIAAWAPVATLDAQQRPAFEVVSIRPAPNVTPAEATLQRLRRVTINGVNARFGHQSLTDLVLRAWGVERYQLDAPGWMDNARFDVSARLPEGASPAQVPEMLQSMLEERFGLKFHRQNRERAHYALTVANNGAKLAPRPENFQRVPGSFLLPHRISAVTSYLSLQLREPVVDRTNLEGEYLIDIEELARAFPRVPRPGAEDVVPPEQASEPPAAAFSLLRKWGLDLKRAKLPISMLVIDHIEKEPSGN